jgi:hypothetical protein
MNSPNPQISVVNCPVAVRVMLGYLDQFTASLATLQSHLGQNLVMLKAAIDSGLLSEEQMELLRSRGKPESASLAENSELNENQLRVQTVTYINAVNHMDDLIASLRGFRVAFARANNETQEPLHTTAEYAAEIMAHELMCSEEQQ